MKYSPAAMSEQQQRRQFVTIAVFIVCLAFSVRAIYLVGAKIEYPIRGDVNQYVLYAWNLTHRGVFSTALPDDHLAEPDSYRGPGYPLMLAMTMRLAGHSELPLRPGPNGRMVLGYETDTWMRLALAAQAILGTLTVLLTIVLARLWLSRSLALAVGMMMALWPHLITFTGMLLSETLFTFTVVLSLLLLCRGERGGRALTMACAGVSFGAAYLVNPVIGLFPVIIALLAIRKPRRLGAVLLVTFMVFPLGWGLRNASLQGEGSLAGRAVETFVIGSWPQFYEAYNSRFDNEVSSQIVSLENEEQTTLRNDPMRGLAMMSERMMIDPVYYAGWYLWKKPYLLWDWAIRIGAGDLYVLKTTNSPLDRYAALRIVVDMARGVNPILFLLVLVALSIVAARKLAPNRDNIESQMPIIPALLFVYVTLIHTVLQAEPRYSTPFRSVEILLACWACGEIYAAFNRVRTRGRRGGPGVSQHRLLRVLPATDTRMRLDIVW